jgi:hypothetical protein
VTKNAQVPIPREKSELPASKKPMYFAAGDSLGVRRGALDEIPDAIGKNLEGGSWST